MTPKFCGPKFKNGGDMAMGAKSEKPHFLETDELCSAYAETLGKLSGRAT